MQDRTGRQNACMYLCRCTRNADCEALPSSPRLPCMTNRPRDRLLSLSCPGVQVVVGGGLPFGARLCVGSAGLDVEVVRAGFNRIEEHMDSIRLITIHSTVRHRCPAVENTKPISWNRDSTSTPSSSPAPQSLHSLTRRANPRAGGDATSPPSNGHLLPQPFEIPEGVMTRYSHLVPRTHPSPSKQIKKHDKTNGQITKPPASLPAPVWNL